MTLQFVILTGRITGSFLFFKLEHNEQGLGHGAGFVPAHTF